MPRFWIGNNGSAWAVKVLRDETLNPETVPDTNYGAFGFNSNISDNAIGAGFCDRAVENSAGRWYGFYLPHTQAGSPLGAWHSAADKMSLIEVQRSEGAFWRTQGYHEFNTGGDDPWGTDYSWLVGWTYSGDIYSVNCDNMTSNWNGQFNALSTPGVDFRLIDWGLPGRNLPLPWTSGGVQSAGQRIFDLSSTVCKIARPGFDTTTAPPQNLIVGGSIDPMHVVATGNFTITGPADQYYRLPEGLGNASVIVDFQYEIDANTRRIPQLTYDQKQADLRYRVLTHTDGFQYIHFQMPFAKTVTALFVAFAVDAPNLTPTSGSVPVLQEGVDAQNVRFIRFSRPGSGSPQQMRDVYVDTRFSYLPIVNQGFVAAPGDKWTGVVPATPITINITDQGYIPFVKVRWHVVNKRDDGVENFEALNSPRMYQDDENVNDYLSWRYDVTRTQIIINHNYGSSRFTGAAITGVARRSVGFRYYVFGIPNYGTTNLLTSLP